MRNTRPFPVTERLVHSWRFTSLPLGNHPQDIPNTDRSKNLGLPFHAHVMQGIWSVSWSWKLGNRLTMTPVKWRSAPVQLSFFFFPYDETADCSAGSGTYSLRCVYVHNTRLRGKQKAADRLIRDTKGFPDLDQTTKRPNSVSRDTQFPRLKCYVCYIVTEGIILSTRHCRYLEENKTGRK
jgi:hypothetical protein